MSLRRGLLGCAVMFGAVQLGYGGACEIESHGVVIDVRQDFGGRLARGEIRLSPFGETLSEGARLFMDGKAVSGWSSAVPIVDSRSVRDGWHDLELVEEGRSARSSLAVLNSSEVAVHGGVISGHEVWHGDRVHIVRNWVRIPAGSVLTIESGAVVKFCQETGLWVDGVLEASGVTFTVVRDDTVGGDTDMMPLTEEIMAGEYGLTGSGKFALRNCVVRYRRGGPEHFDLQLIPGWNLVSLPSGIQLGESNAALLSQLNLFGFQDDTCVRVSLPLGGGTPLWLYSVNGRPVSFVSREEVVRPDLDRQALEGMFIGVPGGEPMKLEAGSVSVVWQWSAGHYELKAADADGGFTLEPGRGYVIFREEDRHE